MLEGRRVALVLLSAMGDVVHAFPLLTSLKARYPDIRLEWFAQPTPGEIARRHPAVDRVWTIRGPSRSRALGDLRRRLRGERFDVVIDLQVYLKASIVTALIDSPRKIGFDRRRARELNWLVTNERIRPHPLQHVCEEYLEFADHCQAPRLYAWPITLSGRDREAQERFCHRRTTPIAALVVGTTRREKEWLPSQWARIANELHFEYGYSVVIVGGRCSSEDTMAGEIVRLATAPVADLRADDVGRLVWLLDASSLLIACDTGPYHVGVALGVPSIGLFAATDPGRYGPVGRFRDLLVDAYHHAGVADRPPSRKRLAGQMGRIKAADVQAMIERARSRYPRTRMCPPSIDDRHRTSRPAARYGGIGAPVEVARW